MSIASNNANVTSIDANNKANESPSNNDQNNMVIKVDDQIGVGIVTEPSQTPLKSNNRRRGQHLFNS